MARHDNFSEMDKRGAKKRTRVILLWWRGGGGAGVEVAGCKGSSSQLSTTKGRTAMCVCLCVHDGVRMCVFVCERERERDDT